LIRTGRIDRERATPIMDETRRELELMGVRIAPVPADEEAGEPVAACNWDSLLAFLACATQWRVGIGFGAMIWVGLDYAGCAVAFRCGGFADHLFEDLRVMEDAALAVLNSGDD
jgi:hypothetical protein